MLPEAKYSVSWNAIVEDGVTIGDGTKVWYFSHLRTGAKIGTNCVIGDHCFLDEGVTIGNNVKLGNGVKVYKGVVIKDNVRVGPGVTFNNVRKAKVSIRGAVLDTVIREGVSILPNATIAAGVTIGVSALIGEGTVVISNVPALAFVAGNPGRIKQADERK